LEQGDRELAEVVVILGDPVADLHLEQLVGVGRGEHRLDATHFRGQHIGSVEVGGPPDDVTPLGHSLDVEWLIGEAMPSQGDPNGIRVVLLRDQLDRRADDRDRQKVVELLHLVSS
jgi:hypothetical protein